MCRSNLSGATWKVWRPQRHFLWSMIHRMNSYWTSLLDFTPDKECIEHIYTHIFTTWKTVVQKDCICIPENASQPLSPRQEYILYCMIIRILREFIRKLWNAASNCNVIHFRTCVVKKTALSRHLRYESEEQKNTCDRMGVTWISGSDWKTFSLFFTALCLKYNRWGANSVSAHLI